MKIWKRVRIRIKWLLRTLVILVVLAGILLGVAIWKQEQIVQHILTYANQHYKGKITLKGSHVSPFANFPYISIDLEGFKIYESKDESLKPILDIQDTYLGFDLWTIISGNYDLKAVYLSDGYIKVVQHKDRSFNITNALKPIKEVENEEEEMPFQLHLQSFTLHNVDIHKIDEATEIDIDAFINEAIATFKVDGSHTMIALNAQYEMNFMQGGDTTLIKHKNFDLDTKIDFDGDKLLLKVAPSIIKLESGHFKLEGSLDIANSQYLDLEIHGARPNFNLIIAFAPEELLPTLKNYDNKGEVFFDATIKGKLADGSIPIIDAKFGCKKGSIKNNSTGEKLDDMEFSGYFRNTSGNHSFTAMEFKLEDFRAKPETGQIYADLEIQNFVSPEIDLKLKSQFDLDFLEDFFSVKGLSDMTGSINLTMNFHDIIDLNNPGKNIERLNSSYFTQLEIRNLNFKSTAFYLPVKDVNLIGHIEGHKVKIDTFSSKIGNSDIFITGSISDLPAILHRSQDSIWVDLKLKSDFLDLTEFTFNDSTQKAAIDEQIKDFRLDLGFRSSAFAFTESKNLPVGEFFIRELEATLKHYPHKLHDFNADIFIEEEDVRVVDFSGELDSSDFHFSGRLKHYDLWMNDILEGDTEIEFDLTSDHLRLEDLLVYQGKNYIPEDYQHEELDHLKLHGRTLLHFKKHALHSIDIYLDQWDCKMKMHNCRFERFNGRIHYEDQRLTTQNFEGHIGRSDFHLDFSWYFGDAPILRKGQHYVHFHSNYLDVNQLLEWNPSPPKTTEINSPTVDHDAGYTIFDIPFWDMNVDIDVDYLVYREYKVKKLDLVAHMSSKRYLYIDTCYMHIGDAYFDINGDFDARDPDDIYFSPNFYVENLNIDRFMIKFDNFGQDYVLSDNLHGIIKGDITGKLHIHKDLTPMLDKSDIVIDLEIVKGELDHYKPLDYLEDFFKDKNLNKVRFDTLQNTFELKDNVLTIPNMTINSSIGFIELWGTQNLSSDKTMNLFFKVPLKMISKAVFQKLFKRKKEEINPDKEDGIQYKGKKNAYIHINLLADANDYEVKLRKDKDLLHEQRKKRLAERRAYRKAKWEARNKAIQEN
jgi:hypothetical protein